MSHATHLSTTYRLGKRVATFGLLSCVFFAASMTSDAQVPAPIAPGTAGTDGVSKVGGGVSQPAVLTKVDPEYAEVARKLLISGTVMLAIIVDQSGNARDFRVVKSLGYGLDEKAVEAVRQWRFRPGMKEGNAVNVRATIEVIFRLLGERQVDRYYAGPMTFGVEAGLTPPVVKDVTMPTSAGDKANETVLLGFSVDSTGSVNNIHSISGPQSGSELLTRNLAKWKFQPAMKGDRSVEATGTVQFVKGQADEVAKLPLSPPISPTNPPGATRSTNRTLPQRKTVKDQGEYDITVALQKYLQAKSWTKAIELLDEWKRRYPVSDFANEREFGYVEPYEMTGQFDKLLDKVNELSGQNLAAALSDPERRQEGLNRLISATASVLSSKSASPGQIAIANRLAQQLKDDPNPPPVPAPAAAATASPGRTPARQIAQTKPTYTGVGKLLLATGVVRLQVTVAEDGIPRDVKVIGSLGYGLDERAVEAVQQWRYAPALVGGSPVPIVTTADINFTIEGPPNSWYSGPLVFTPGTGVPPSVLPGGMRPKPDKEFSNESAVLGFTVDSHGAVKDIHALHGSEAAVKLLTQSLATWKFQPAMKGVLPVEAAGTVSFIKGQGDEVAKRLVPAPPVPQNSSAAPAVNAGPIRTMVNATDGQRYVWIPPGGFTMGCSPGDTECDNNEKPPHEVRIANGFWLGQTEVTQAAYMRVTGANPSNHKGDQLPVETLTWNNAANYCRAIGGRLPAEAEWEYAARGGVTWARYGSLDGVAWYPGNAAAMTHPVALKQANAFGLYDMLGNVWEWVEDSYVGTASKILRGGSTQADATNARASRRWVVEPAAAIYRGFRCAGDFPDQEPKSAAQPSPRPGIEMSGSQPPVPNQAAVAVAAAGQGPAKEVLDKVGSVYSRLTSIRVSGKSEETQTTRGQGVIRQVEYDLAAQGNNYYLKVKLDGQEAIAASDGENTWKAMVSRKQWSRVEAATAPGNGQNEVGAQSSSDLYSFMAANVFSDYPLLARMAQDVEIVREADYKLASGKVRCYVLHARAGKLQEELWVDKERFLVLERIEKTATEATQRTTRIQVNSIDVNEKMPVSVFRLQPDKSWSEVAAVLLPGEQATSPARNPTGSAKGVDLASLQARKFKDAGEEAILSSVAKDFENGDETRAIKDLKLWEEKYPDSDFKDSRAPAYEGASKLKATRLTKKASDSGPPFVETPANVESTAGPISRIGSGVSAPAVASKIDPEYSEAARLFKHSGTVMLAVVVDADGQAKDIRVVKSLGLGLDEKAVEAVQKWIFKPGMKQGLAVPVRATIEVNFRLL
jgi:TonB family protein